MTKTPKSLFKFCPINVNSMRAIAEAEVYHAPPISFNDPLDCNPTIQIDSSKKDLVGLLVKMMTEKETQAQVDDWLDSLRSIDTLNGESLAVKEDEKFIRDMIVARIKSLLTQEFGVRGVLSLSEKWDEPLLWSHYADQHRGICIEYDISQSTLPNLNRVNYNAPRSIRTNDLFRWKVDGDEEAARRVYNGYFYAKAPEWEYENEWRDVGERAGASSIDTRISAIHFGMRCDPVWQRIVVKLLSKDHDIDLFSIRPKDDTFKLDRIRIERGNLENAGIQQSPYRILGRRGDILDTDKPVQDNSEAIARLIEAGMEAERQVKSGMFGRGPGGLFGLPPKT